MDGTRSREDAQYARVSLDKTGAAFGVESQGQEIEDFTVDELGFQVTRSYQDNDTSAFSGVERPDYRRMLADIAAGRIRSVTIWHANRLHRSLEEAGAFIKLARQHKIKLFSVARGGEYNFGKVEGRKAFLSDTLDAQSESEHRGERVALARKRQARRGDYGGGGERPYGWGVDSGRVRSVCVNPKAPTMERLYEDRPVLDMTRHNPTEAEEIRRWARELLSGVPMNAVLRDLAARGVVTVIQQEGKTRRYRGKEVKSKGWNSRTIQQILTHPRVSGHSVYQGEIITRDAWPAIIAEETRQALITLFADPTRKTSPGNTPKWLGSLIYQCGRCNDGSVMTCRYANGGQRVYRCKPHQHCQWDADQTDTFVTDVVIERLSRDDVADLIPRQGEPIDIEALHRERKELELRKKQAGISFARQVPGFDQEMLETICETVDADIADIDAQLKTATHDSPLTPFLTSTDPRATWEGLTLGRQREVLRTLFDVTLQPIGRGGKFNDELIKINRPERPAPTTPEQQAA